MNPRSERIRIRHHPCSSPRIRILGFIIGLLGAYYIVADCIISPVRLATVFGRFRVLLFLVIIVGNSKMTKGQSSSSESSMPPGRSWTLLTPLP